MTTARARMNFCARRLAPALLAVWAAGAVGAGVTDPRVIERTAADFVVRQTQSLYPETARIEPGPIDPRLRMPVCDRALTASFAPGARRLGAVHVGVRCQGTSPWLVYVPVKISVRDQALAATRALPRGQVLSAQDVISIKRDIAELPAGYVPDDAQALGKRLRQPVVPGAVLTHNLLEVNPVVKRGETVTIVAKQGAIEVRAAGRALGDGGVGQAVEVKNTTSKRTLRATVTGAGEVEVGP